jgi:hypothetical protein
MFTLNVKSQAVILRFFKGAAASGASAALVSIGTLATNNPTTLQSLGIWSGLVFISFIVGAVTGLLMAIEKYWNYVDPSVPTSPSSDTTLQK